MFMLSLNYICMFLQFILFLSLFPVKHFVILMKTHYINANVML